MFFVTDNNNTLDKTWAEILSASENGVVVLNWNDSFGYLMRVIHGKDYLCTFIAIMKGASGFDTIDSLTYTASAENDYPAKA